MNITDLRDSLTYLADQTPEDPLLRDDIRAGAQRRMSRRRRTALVSVAAIVALVASGSFLLGGARGPATNAHMGVVGQSSNSAPHNTSTTVTSRTTTLPSTTSDPSAKPKPSPPGASTAAKQVAAPTKVVPLTIAAVHMPVSLSTLQANLKIDVRMDTPDMHTVGLMDTRSNAAQAIEISYLPAGPMTVPSSATAINLAGHSAKAWSQNGSGPDHGTSYFAMWSTTTGAAVLIEADTRAEVTVGAGLVTAQLDPVPSTLIVPTTTVTGYTALSVNAQGLGGSSVQLGGSLCQPNGTRMLTGDLALSESYERCITIEVGIPQEPLVPSGLTQQFASWKVITVSGQAVHVSADGTQVVTRDSRGEPVMLSTAANLGIAATDLAAVAAGINR